LQLACGLIFMASSRFHTVALRRNQKKGGYPRRSVRVNANSILPAIQLGEVLGCVATSTFPSSLPCVGGQHLPTSDCEIPNSGAIRGGAIPAQPAPVVE